MQTSLRLSNLFTYKGRCDWPYVITYDNKYHIYRSYVPIKSYTYWVLEKCEFEINGEVAYIIRSGI